MPGPGGDATKFDWPGSVEVREDPELERELTARLPPPTAPRAVSVTDLVAPRRAFWRAVAPVRVPAERRDRMDLGRAIHRRLEAALASEGTLEARVRRDGVVGRIDVLADVPIEVKTSASTVDAAQLTLARPDQVEQLAMYAALVGQPAGRLVTLVVSADARPAVQVVDLRFDATEPLRAEMVVRAEALRRAWAAGNPGGLPACRWFGRGCEFEDQGVCRCDGREPAVSDGIRSRVVEVRDRADLAAGIRDRLSAEAPAERPGLAPQFRDLVYPRRAYFRATVAEPPVEFPARPPTEPPDLYARLVAAVEGGPIGEVARLRPQYPGPDEEVVGFRGWPYLLRSSRARARATAASLLEGQPQYGIELGFRCAATGVPSARLLLGRERAVDAADRVQVFELRFAPTGAFARLAEERAHALARAVRERSPAALPACPAWMYADCPYRADCGCGAAASDRSQR